MDTRSLKSLSIFFPAYNEADNIENSIKDALLYAPKVADKFEIIIVDDGSKDSTASIVESIAQKNPKVRLVRHNENKGYGEAVKTGIKSAKYEWTFFTDSDGQFHFSELEKFVSSLDGYDLIVGYRKKRRDPFMRIIIAQFMLKYWNFVFFGLWMKDVDCAFKLIPTKILQKLTLVTSSAITVTEIMVRLKHQGCTIREVPVTHFSRKKGIQTGSNPHVILRAFRESFRLWKELNA